MLCHNHHIKVEEDHHPSRVGRRIKVGGLILNNRLTRTCFFYIRQLRSIRRSLTVDSSHALVRALILTRLDYCNGLLGGAPKCLLSPLSRVLRAAARLILLLPRTSSVENEIRTVLHWLDVPARVTFKLCLLAHRCLHGSAPPYLIRYFTPVSSIVGRSHLRSAATGTVLVPGSRTSTIWTSGVRRLLSVCMEQSPGWSSWPRAQSFWLSDVDSKLICLILLVIYLLSCPFDSYFLYCSCLWTAQRLLWQIFWKA